MVGRPARGLSGELGEALQLKGGQESWNTKMSREEDNTQKKTAK